MRSEILFALERLLQKRTYIEIGIKEICAEAHISKPTFYRYFKSKDNIIHWMSKEAIFCGVAQVGRKYSWYEGSCRTISVFYRHRVFYCDPQSYAVTTSLIASSSEYLKTALTETLTHHKGVVLTEKLAFQIKAFNYVQGYMLRKWAEDGMHLLPRTLAEHLVSVVPSELFELLNEPTDKKVPTDEEPNELLH